MSDERAEIIVDGIIRDLSERRGLRHEWERIDEDIQQEIRAEWISIVRSFYPEGSR